MPYRFVVSWLVVIGIGMSLGYQKPVTQTQGIAPAGPTDSLALGLRMKADAFYTDNRPDSALFYARASASRAEQTKDWHTWGEAQTYIIAALAAKNENAAAAAMFPLLESKAQMLIPPGRQDSAFWTDFYDNAGAVYSALGNFEAALRYGLKGIEFYEKLGPESVDLFRAKSNVGVYYQEQGDYDHALYFTLAALNGFSTLPKAEPEDLIRAYHNLSIIYYRKKLYSEAIGFADKGLAVLRGQRMPFYELEAYLNFDIGNANADLKNYSQALPYFHRALQIQHTHKKEIEDRRSYTLDGLGYVYSRIGQYPESMHYLQAARDLMQKDDPYYGKLCRHLGLLYQVKGDLRRSLEWQQNALNAISSDDAVHDLLANPAIKGVNAYYDFMYGLKEKGETLQLLAAKEPNPDLLKASLAAFDLATAVLDSMRSIYQEGSKQFWNQEARPVLEKAIGIALQLRQNTGDEQYLARAFDYAEKGKAYLLAESLLESAAQQQAGIPDSTLEREKQIKIDIAFYRKKVFELQHAGTPDTAKMLRWQSEIQRRHSAYEALMDTLKSRYPAYYQARYRQQITGMAQIRKELPDDTGLLEYFCGEHATYAFYIDRDHANAARCGADSSLGRVLAGLRKEDSQSDEHILSADAVHAFATDANSLYRSLMAPVMDHTPKQLILIADGQLAYLPFEILVTQPVSDISQPAYATLPYLLRATTIRYEYSALLTFQKPSERHATRFWDGYAPGYSREMVAQPLRGRKSDCQGWSASDFAPLPNNGKEIGQIAGLTGGRAIAGPEASEAFFRLHAREPRILHLAMHGFLNDCDPAYSGLVFSPSTADQSVKDTLLKEEQDGILHAYEIYNLHLNAELAVLSACNTGRGQLAQGEGVMSLARAFKYAGCPNVLMSLWQAHDAATAEIMQGFYRYLKQGYGKAAAIRAAKLDYLIAAPRSRQHPFFWGAFVLIGDDLPVKETTTTMWYIAGLLLLALVVFILHRVIKSGRNDRKWKLRLVNSN